MNLTNWNASKLSEWISTLGSKFEPLAKEFLANHVEGEDIMDESIFSREMYDDMLDGVSTQFARNKLWKKLQDLKNQRDAQRFFSPFITDTSIWSQNTVDVPREGPMTRARTPSYAEKMKEPSAKPQIQHKLMPKPAVQTPK